MTRFESKFKTFETIYVQIPTLIPTTSWRLFLLNTYQLTTETSQQERFLECPSNEAIADINLPLIYAWLPCELQLISTWPYIERIFEGKYTTSVNYVYMKICSKTNRNYKMYIFWIIFEWRKVKIETEIICCAWLSYQIWKKNCKEYIIKIPRSQQQNQA